MEGRSTDKIKYTSVCICYGQFRILCMRLDITNDLSRDKL